MVTLRQIAVALRAGAFGSSASGNAASMFALALAPILAATGAAVDYSMLASQKSRLQAAADAAALAVAAAPPDAPGLRMQLARKVVLGNFDTGGAASSVDVAFTEPQPGFYRVDASAQAPMTFMQIFGISQATIHASAQSQTASGGGTVEVAMAVDVSGSMRATDMGGGAMRIDILKQVANTMVDTLSARLPSSRLKFATIPFNTNVNIGRTNTAYVTGNNHPLFTGTSWAGCVLERSPPNHLSTGYDGSASPATGKFRAFIAPPEPDSFSASAGSCVNRSNGTNTGYFHVQETDPTFPMGPMTNGPNFNCVRHVMQPLTNSVTDVKSKINSLSAEGNWGTIVTPGLMWALRALTPDAPFPGAAPFSSSNKKVIIALTDGEQVTDSPNYVGAPFPTCTTNVNTVTPYSFNPADIGLTGRTLTQGPADIFNAYGYIRDSDPFNINPTNSTQVDAYLDTMLLQACDLAKSKPNVEIFTIAVSNRAGPDTRAYTTMSRCASDDAHFFYAPDHAALATAFDGIANRVAPMSRVRLTR